MGSCLPTADINIQVSCPLHTSWSYRARAIATTSHSRGAGEWETPSSYRSTGILKLDSPLRSNLREMTTCTTQRESPSREGRCGRTRAQLPAPCAVPMRRQPQSVEEDEQQIAERAAAELTHGGDRVAHIRGSRTATAPLRTEVKPGQPGRTTKSYPGQRREQVSDHFSQTPTISVHCSAVTSTGCTAVPVPPGRARGGQRVKTDVGT